MNNYNIFRGYTNRRKWGKKNLKMSVHQRIRKIRMGKGITQVAVARKLGIPITTYNSYELGRRRLRVEYLPLISRVLGVPITDFFEDNLYES